MTIRLSDARRAVGPNLILFTASTGCTLTVLDTNVVAIVLPTIARDLGAGFADIEWVISTYILCFASLLLPAGAIADRFGRRKVFLIGISIFALAPFLCGLAPSAPLLYLSRAVQGVGAAFLLAPALAIIGHTFHGEIERNWAWGIWGGMMGFTMALSPVVGGVIVYVLGWRWAFNINILRTRSSVRRALLALPLQSRPCRRSTSATITAFACIRPACRSTIRSLPASRAASHGNVEPIGDRRLPATGFRENRSKAGGPVGERVIGDPASE
jgi:MFS family permease